MEGTTEVNELEGAGNAVHPDEDQARLIGEILAEFIAELGSDRAMTPECVVTFGGGPEIGSRPLPTLDICRSVRRTIGGLASPDQRGASPVNAEGSGVGVVCLIPPGHGYAARSCVGRCGSIARSVLAVGFQSSCSHPSKVLG